MLSFLADDAVCLVLDLALEVDLIVHCRVMLGQRFCVGAEILFVAETTTCLGGQVNTVLRVVCVLLALLGRFLCGLLLGLVFGCAIGFLGGF